MVKRIGSGDDGNNFFKMFSKKRADKAKEPIQVFASKTGDVKAAGSTQATNSVVATAGNVVQKDPVIVARTEYLESLYANVDVTFPDGTNLDPDTIDVNSELFKSDIAYHERHGLEENSLCEV